MIKAVLLILVLCFTAVNITAKCSEADKSALKEFDGHWSTAGQTGDKTALMAIYAEDYVGFPTMEGKASAIDATMRTFEQNKAKPENADKATYDHYMISCTPTTATVTHRNVIWSPAANGGKGGTFYTRSVHFLEKRNGQWMVVSNAGGPLSEADMLRYMELDWINAVKTRNMGWFEKNYAPDFTEVSFVTGKMMNKQQAIESLKADKTTFDAMEVSDLNIRIEGNSAVVTGMGWAKGKDGAGKPFDMKLRFTDTFIKRDGRWMAWASQATAIQPESNIAKN